MMIVIMIVVVIITIIRHNNDNNNSTNRNRNSDSKRKSKSSDIVDNDNSNDNDSMRQSNCHPLRARSGIGSPNDTRRARSVNLCLLLRPVHLLRVFLLRVLESNFPGDSL